MSYENYQRGQSREKKNARPENLKYVDHMDLLNFMREHALPESVDLMEDGKMYAVDRLADIWERFPNTTAMALVMKRNIEWIGQLLKTRWSWALHGDGKHKVHHGRWILMTFGTHALRWDIKTKQYMHTFCPLIYIFSKQHETIESVKLSMVCLQLAAEHFFGERLCPAVCISDHADGLMQGMQEIGIDPEGEEPEPLKATPRLGDWAHMAVKYRKGELLNKTNPYYGEYSTKCKHAWTISRRTLPCIALM